MSKVFPNLETYYDRVVLCHVRISTTRFTKPRLRLRDDHRDRINEILRAEKWKTILTIYYTHGKMA